MTGPRLTRIRGGRNASPGFTLIELLVVLTLVSLIALAMAGAMGTMAQTESRVDARVERAEDFRIATGFIRSTLGRASVRKLDPPPPMGRNTALFFAEDGALSWLGVMPARHGAGGRTFFRLAKEDAGNGRAALVIRFVPAGNATAFPDWQAAESRVLVQDVTGFSIAFLDGRDPAAAWRAQWEPIDRLPDVVKLGIETAGGPWPDLMVAVRVLPIGGRSQISLGPE